MKVKQGLNCFFSLILAQSNLEQEKEVKELEKEAKMYDEMCTRLEKEFEIEKDKRSDYDRKLHHVQ